MSGLRVGAVASVVSFVLAGGAGAAQLKITDVKAYAFLEHAGKLSDDLVSSGECLGADGIEHKVVFLEGAILRFMRARRKSRRSSISIARKPSPRSDAVGDGSLIIWDSVAEMARRFRGAANSRC